MIEQERVKSIRSSLQNSTQKDRTLLSLHRTQRTLRESQKNQPALNTKPSPRSTIGGHRRRHKSYKPYAEDLRKHPKLQELLYSVQEQDHPIDSKGCFFGEFALNYARKYIRLATQVTLSQKCHYNLPGKDRIGVSRDRIGEWIFTENPKKKGVESQNKTHPSLLVDTDAGMSFYMRPKLKRGVFEAFLRAYSLPLISSLFGTFLVILLQFASIYCIRISLELIRKQLDARHRIFEPTKILPFFAAIWVSKTLSDTLDSYTQAHRQRIILRFIGGVGSITFEKSLKIGLENPQIYTPQSIVEGFEDNLMLINQKLLSSLDHFLKGIISIPFIIGLGVDLFGLSFLVVFFGYILVTAVNLFLSKFGRKPYAKWVELMKRRSGMLANVLRNIKMVKKSGSENVQYTRLCNSRRDELKARATYLVVCGILELYMQVGTALSIICFLYLFIKNGGILNVPDTTILLILCRIVEESLFAIPKGWNDLKNMINSCNKINRFLGSEELEAYKIRREASKVVRRRSQGRDGLQDPNASYAVEVLNGGFYWDKPVREEEARKIRDCEIPKQASQQPNASTGKLKTGKSASQTPGFSSNVVASNNSRTSPESDMMLTESERLSMMRQTLLTSRTESAQRYPEDLIIPKIYSLDSLNFRAQSRKLTVVLGAAKSGRSSLVSAVLGEMRISNFSTACLRTEGRIGFLKKDPWLVRGTVRENVVMGREFDFDDFDYALKFSCLEADLDLWGQKEDQMIGGEGFVLTHSQRIRIGLARLLYHRPDVYILDDILPHLEPEFSQHILENTIIQQLQGRTVILLTSRIGDLKHADFSYIMEEGCIVEEGAYEIIKYSQVYNRYLDTYTKGTPLQNITEADDNMEDHSSSRSSQDHSRNKYPARQVKYETSFFDKAVSFDTIDKMENPINPSKSSVLTQSRILSDLSLSRYSSQTSQTNIAQNFIQNEEAYAKEPNLLTLHIYIESLGGYLTVLLLITANLITKFLLIFSVIYLEEWSRLYNARPAAERLEQLQYYALIWLAFCTATFTQNVLKYKIAYSVSNKLHGKMAFALLHSRIQKLLDLVPVERIHTRFIKDINQVDLYLVNQFHWLVDNLTMVVVLFVAIGYSISFWLMILILPTVLLLILREKAYTTARRAYMRLLAEARSRVLQTLSDVLNGLSYIRGVSLRQYFRAKFLKNLTNWLKNEQVNQVLLSWFNMRSELVQHLLILLPTLLGILYYFNTRSFDMTDLGLFFFCYFLLGSFLSESVSLKTEWETSLAAVDKCVYFINLKPEPGYIRYSKQIEFYGKSGSKRIKRLINLELEKDMQTERFILVGKAQHRTEKKERKALIEEIIKSGGIAFKNVSAKYFAKQSYAIKDLSLTISPSEKICIVGESKSGKSSIINLLWRYLDPKTGAILIDGKDISQVDLKSLRSQMNIVSSEDTLLEGTLRENLDPFGFRFRDKDMIHILNMLKFQNTRFARDGLDYRIVDQARNMSLENRRRILMARAMLRPTKLVMFDGIFRGVGRELKRIFRENIESYFNRSTVLMVGDDVANIMGCDRVLVIKDGEIVAFDTPEQLNQVNGYFTNFVDMMKKGRYL